MVILYHVLNSLLQQTERSVPTCLPERHSWAGQVYYVMYRLLVIISVVLIQVDFPLYGQVQVELDHDRVYVLSDSEARGIRFNITYLDSDSLVDADTFYLHLSSQISWDAVSNTSGFTIVKEDSNTLMFDAPTDVDTNTAYSFTSFTVKANSLTSEFQPLTVSLFTDSAFVDTSENGLKVVEFDTITNSKRFYISGDTSSTNISITFNDAALYPNYNLFLQLPDGFEWDIAGFQPPSGVSQSLENNNHRLLLGINSELGATLDLSGLGLKIIPTASDSATGVIQVALLDASEGFSPGQYSTDSLYFDTPQFKLAFKPVAMVGDTSLREFADIIVESNYPQVLDERVLTVTLPLGLKWTNGNQSILVTLSDASDTLINQNLDAFGSSTADAGKDNLEFTFNDNESIYQSVEEITVTSIISDTIPNNNWIIGDGERNLGDIVITFSESPFISNYYLYIHLVGNPNLSFSGSPSSILGQGIIVNGNTVQWDIDETYNETSLTIENLNIFVPTDVDTGSYGLEFAILRSNEFGSQNQLSTETINIYEPTFDLSYTPVYVTSDIGKRSFPSISIGGISNGDVITNRSLSIRLPLGLEWEDGDSVFTTSSLSNSDTILVIEKPIDSDSASLGMLSPILSFDGNTNNYLSEPSIVVTEFESIVIPQFNFISGDTLLQDSIKIHLKNDGFYPDHTLHLKLPGGFTWDTTSFSNIDNITLSLENTSRRLKLAFTENFSPNSTIQLLGLSVFAEGDSGTVGFIESSILYESEDFSVGQYHSSNSVFVGKPAFVLSHPQQYGLEPDSYRPVYILNDPYPRPILPIKIKEDSYRPVLANRTVEIALPDSMLWESFGVSGVLDLSISSDDSNRLIIKLPISTSQEQQFQIDSLKIRNFNSPTEQNSQLDLNILRNSGLLSIDNSTIEVVEPPTFTFTNEDSSQVFWTAEDGSKAKWEIKGIFAENQEGLFDERDIYFQTQYADNLVFNDEDIVTHVDIDSTDSIDTVKIGTLTVKEVFESQQIKFCITGNPTVVTLPYWIPAELLIFRSVNPKIHVDPQAFLKGDTDDSIHVEIMAEYPIAFQESAPFVVLPDSFPGDFQSGGKESLISWNNADTVEKSLPLGVISGVKDWAPIILRHPHPEWAIDTNAVYRFSDDKSVKVGTYYAPILSNEIMVFTYHDPESPLDMIKILLGYDTLDTFLGVQPLIKGDSVYLFLDSDGVMFDEESVTVALNFDSNISDKLGNPAISADGLTLSIPVINDLENADTLLTLTGLKLKDFSDTTHHIFSIKVSLRTPADMAHSVFQIADIGIGKPTIPDQRTVYPDPGMAKPLYSLSEDTVFSTLDNGSILCFKLSDTSIASWDTTRYDYTSGYGDGWDNISHRPVSLIPNQKCYEIKSTFNPGEKANFYLFDNLILKDNLSEDPVWLTVSNNGGVSTFDSTLIQLRAPPTCIISTEGEKVSILKSKESFTLDALNIENIPDSADTVEIVIPHELSLYWDEYSIFGVDSFSIEAVGEEEGKRLVIVLNSSPDSIVLSDITLNLYENSSSGKDFLKVFFKCDGGCGDDIISSVISDKPIILGTPTGGIDKHFIFIGDDTTGILPLVSIGQDLLLYTSYSYPFIDKGDTVSVHINDDVMFDPSSDIIVQYIINEDTIPANDVFIDDTALTIHVDTSFEEIIIDSLRIKTVSGTSTITPFPLTYKYNGEEFTQSDKTIRLTNPIVSFAEKHLSVHPDRELMIGDVTIEQPDSVLVFIKGVQVVISALVENYPGGEKLIKWRSNPFPDNAYFDTVAISQPSDPRAHATVSLDFHEDSLILMNLNPEVEIDSLLLSDNFSVELFANGKSLRILLGFISNNSVRFSSDTVWIESEDTFFFHLPPFLTYPSFLDNTLIFEIIDGLYKPSGNANWKDVFRLLPANSGGEFFDSLGNILWPEFTSVDTSSLINTTRFSPSRTIGEISKINRSQNKPTKTMRESKKLSKKNKRVKSDIRLDSRRQNKPENHHNKKRKAKASAVNEKTASSSGNYTRTVTAVFDSTTLIWFNELMFDHIQNSTNPKDLFYIGLTDSISTSDTEVQNHNSDYRREFGAVPVDFSSFDPLADSAIVEVPNRVFGTRYNLTLRNSNGDEINDTFIQIFSQDTTINTADLNQTFSSLSEGLYLIKVSGIDSSFTIYRQVIKDTTKPKISSIQPLQRLHAPGNPLTVSFGADTLALRYLDNFKMDDSLLYEFVLPDSIINNGTDTLKQGKKYRLWSQFFPMPKLSIQFQSKSIEAPDSLFEENEFSYRLDTLIFSDNLRHTFKEFLKFNDGDSLTGNVNVIITVNDAAGNTFSDTLEYNVMTKKKEGFISNHIFNYPNPFPAGERTTFRYVLSDNITNGQLAIFDAAGDLIYYWDLTQNNLNTPGTHFIEWDGKNLFGRRLSTGVYFGYFEVEYESKRKREYSFLKIAINNR